MRHITFRALAPEYICDEFVENRFHTVYNDEVWAIVEKSDGTFKGIAFETWDVDADISKFVVLSKKYPNEKISLSYLTMIRCDITNGDFAMYADDRKLGNDD